MKHRFGLPIGDILLLLFILLAAVFLFLFPFMYNGAATAAEIVIAQTGQVRTIPLDADAAYDVSSQSIHLTVQVENGTVFISHSDCRDGICRNTPPISRAGQSIVCAPAGIVVRITGEGAVVDGVAG